MEEGVNTKKCSKCGEVKGIGEFRYAADRPAKRHSQCKKCVRKYYEENKEHILQRTKIWRLENPEKHKKKVREYVLRNKDIIAKRKHEYYLKNREKYRQLEKLRRIEKKEELARYEKMRWERDKDKLREYKSKWHQANKDRINEKARKNVKALDDSYIINNISQLTGLKREQISPELIGVKRAIITAKRELKSHKTA